MNRAFCTPVGRQRTLFGLAGTMTLLGTALAATTSPWFALIPALVGVNQLMFATIGTCPASAFLGRICAGGER